MKIDIRKVIDTYGDSVGLLIRDNLDDVLKNIEYMISLNFTDVEDIFERYALLFLDTPSEFKEKINNLINGIGNGYVDIIENDLSIFEDLMWVMKSPFFKGFFYVIIILHNKVGI